MARGTIHPQKENRRRRNTSPIDKIELERDGEIRGPELEELTGRDDWAPGVVKWYETWRRSPQAQVFEDTDWARLGMLAPIVQTYLKRPSAAALSEIRMNEERLGATVTDRQRARMVISGDEDSGQTAQVISLADTRRSIAERLKGGK